MPAFFQDEVIEFPKSPEAAAAFKVFFYFEDLFFEGVMYASPFQKSPIHIYKRPPFPRVTNP